MKTTRPIPPRTSVEGSGVAAGGSPWPPGGGTPKGPPTKWPPMVGLVVVKPATNMAKSTEPRGGGFTPSPAEPNKKCCSVAFAPRPLIVTETGLGRDPPAAEPLRSQLNLPKPLIDFVLLKVQPPGPEI